MKTSENTSLQLPISEKALPKLISSSGSSVLKSCPLFPRVILSVQQQQVTSTTPTPNIANISLGSADQLAHHSPTTMSTLPMTTSVTTNSQSSNSGNSANSFFPLILAAAATSHPAATLSATPVSLQLHVNTLQPNSVASTMMHQPISASGTVQPHFVSTSLLSPISGSGSPVVALSQKTTRSINSSMLTTCTSSPSLIATFANRNITIGNTNSPIVCNNGATFASVVITPQQVTNVQSPAFALRFATAPFTSANPTMMVKQNELSSPSPAGGLLEATSTDINVIGTTPYSVVGCRSTFTATTTSCNNTMASFGPGSALVFSSLPSNSVTSLSASSCNSATTSPSPSRMLIHKSSVVSNTGGGGDQLPVTGLNHITAGGSSHASSSLSFVVTDPHHHHQLVATLPSSQSSCRAKYISIATTASTTPVPILPTQLRLMPTTSATPVAPVTTTSTYAALTTGSITSTIGASVTLPSGATPTAGCSYFIKPSGGNGFSMTSPTACNVSPKCVTTTATGAVQHYQQQHTWPAGGTTTPSGAILTLHPVSSSAIASAEPSPLGVASGGQHLLVHTADDSSTAMRATTIATATTSAVSQVPPLPTLLTFSLTPANPVTSGLIYTTSSSSLVPAAVASTHHSSVGGRPLAVTYASAHPTPSLVIRAATTGCSSGSLTFSVSTVGGGGPAVGGASSSATSLVKPVSSSSSMSNAVQSPASHHQHLLPVNIAPATCRASGQAVVGATSTMVSPLRSSIVSNPPSLVSVSPAPPCRHGSSSVTSSPILPLVSSCSLAGSRKRARKQQLASTSPSSTNTVGGNAAVDSTKPVLEGVDSTGVQVIRSALPTATLLPLASGRQPLTSASSATVVTFTNGNNGSCGATGGRSALIPSTGLHLMANPSILSPRGQQTPPLISASAVTEWTTSSCPTVGGHVSTTGVPSAVPTTTSGSLVGIRLLSIRPPAGVTTVPTNMLGSPVSISSGPHQLSSVSAGEPPSLVVPMSSPPNGGTIAPAYTCSPTVRLSTASTGSNSSITTALLSPTLEQPNTYLLPAAAHPVGVADAVTPASCSPLVAAAGGLVQLRCRSQAPAPLSSDGHCPLGDTQIVLAKESDAGPLAKATSCAKPGSTGHVRPSLLVNHYTSLLHRHLRSTPSTPPAVAPSPSSIIKTVEQTEGNQGCLVPRVGELVGLQHDSSSDLTHDTRLLRCEVPGSRGMSYTHHQQMATTSSVSDAVSGKHHRLSTGTLAVTETERLASGTARHSRKRPKLSQSLSAATRQEQQQMKISEEDTAIAGSSASHVADEIALLPAISVAQNIALVKSEEAVNTPQRRPGHCVLTVNPSTGCEWILTGLPHRPSIFNGDSLASTTASTKSTHFLAYSEIRHKPSRIGTDTSVKEAPEDGSSLPPPLLKKYDHVVDDHALSEKPKLLKSEDDDLSRRRCRSTRRGATTQRTAILTRRQAAAREKQNNLQHQQQQQESEELEDQQQNQLQHTRCYQPSAGALQRRLLSDLFALSARQADSQLVRFPVTSTSPLDLTGWRVISCSNNITQLIGAERLGLETLNKLTTCLLPWSHPTSLTRVVESMQSEGGATDVSTPVAHCCCRRPHCAREVDSASLGEDTLQSLSTHSSFLEPQWVSAADAEMRSRGDCLLELIKGICQRKQQLVASLQRLQQHTVSLVQHFRPRALQLSLDLEAMTRFSGVPSIGRPSVQENDDNNDADTEEDGEEQRNLVTRDWSGPLAFLTGRRTTAAGRGASGGMPLRRSTRQRRRGRSSPTSRSRRSAAGSAGGSAAAAADSGGSKVGGKRRPPPSAAAEFHPRNEGSVYKQQQIVCNGLGRASATRK